MAKGKHQAGGNNNNNNDNDNDNNNIGEKNNNNDGEKNNNNNINNNNGGGSGSGSGGGGEYLNVVLKVNFHCNGCTQRIRKHIRSFPGACTVDLEGENTVKIIALKNMDFVKLRETLEKKLGKTVELISPKPPKIEPKKDDKANDKPKELPFTTVLLKLPHHCDCDGCWRRSRKVLRSYKGVFEVLTDKEKNAVTVKGKVDAKQMLIDIKKRLKNVELVPEKKEKKEGGEKDGEKKQDNNGGGVKGDKMVINQVPYDQYVYGSMVLFPTPQMFSDENPNACSIM